jgi:hypothetical protein
MKTTLLTVLFVLVGCSGGTVAGIKPDPGPAGPQGLQGLQGPQGPTGPQGPAVKSLMYYDATGSLVGPVNPTGQALYVDDSGLLWNVSAAGGSLSVPSLTLTAYYESTDCSGPAFINANAALPLPRVPFISGSNGILYVVPDTGMTSIGGVVAQSMGGLGSGGCGQATNTITGFAVSQMTPSSVLTAPTLPFTGPLHLEYK